MEAPGSARGPKAGLSQRSQERRDLVGLQEQGGKIFTRSSEEKLRQNREPLPSLQAALQEDSNTLKSVLKHNKLPIKDDFGEGWELVSGTQNLEVVIKKLEAEIHDQVKVSDMLAHQLKQWRQARDERQRRLQALQDAAADPKWQEQQLQTIRRLSNDIEKMLLKIRSGEIMTNVYLRLQEVLRRELVYLPRCLDLLSGMTVTHREELAAGTTLKANNVIKKLMTEAGPQVHVEKQLRDQSLAEQRKHIESLRRQEKSERQQRQQAVYMLSAEQDQSSSETLMGADVEAAMAKTQREAFVTDKMEKAKTALQCSCLWDIPRISQAQRKSLEKLQQYADECKERNKVLKKTLKKLELERAKLKSEQPLSNARKREEELRDKLKREEARLEQMRAQMMSNQKRLIEFENIIDNIFLRLQGISIPGKEDSGAVLGMEEKLQHCAQKLRFLKERMAAQPEGSIDEHSETFIKVRNILEESIAADTRNLRISFEDEDATEDDTSDFEDDDRDYVPSREDIKKEGQELIRMNTRHHEK